VANPISFTTAEIGAQLKISEEAVRDHIHAGRLRAVNVGNGSRRPRWRITAEALDEFLAAQTAPPRATRRPRKRRGPVIEFF
jgi:excisionase family DNA binding protein